MADESKLTVVHSYSDDDGMVMDNFGVTELEIDVTTKRPTEHKVSVATTEQVIDLDGLTASGCMIVLKNLDATNYVEIRSATGASNDIVRVNAGEVCAFRFGSDITAPYIIANSAAVLVRYRLIPL